MSRSDGLQTGFSSELTRPIRSQKNYSPQRHRGHREHHCLVNCVTGAVNKIKLCASVVKQLLVLDCRAMIRPLIPGQPDRVAPHNIVSTYPADHENEQSQGGFRARYREISLQRDKGAYKLAAWHVSCVWSTSSIYAD